MAARAEAVENEFAPAGTGYEATADAALGLTRLTDPDGKPPRLKAGTKATFGCAGFEFVEGFTDDDGKERQPYIAGTFEWALPKERAGTDPLDERYYLSTTPSNPKRPGATTMAWTIERFARIVAAVLNKEVTSPEVQAVFAGLGMFKADVLGAFVPELVARMNKTCTGKRFDTNIAVEKSQRGAFFNSIGTPIYPDPNNKRPEPKNAEAVK